MSEWWTYSLSDFLLFSPRTYYRLFELYNAEIWPLQVAALLLGAGVLVLLLRGPPWRGRAIAAALASCWLWVAWAYLLARYDTINWAARYFAAGFAVEAGLLAWSGILRDRLGFPDRPDLAAWTGACILLFALAVGPLLAPLAGRPWAQAQVFGVTPDPTAIATLGILTAARRAHWGLLAIPLVWCAVGGATLWTMQAPDASVLFAAAMLAVMLAAWKSWRRGRSRPRQAAAGGG
jgi:hypothetical protein